MSYQDFGTWMSPISAELVAAGAVQFQDLVVDGKDIYFSEMRPNESGRTTILKVNADRSITECIPSSFNVRTRVHEYGKGAFTVFNGILYFIHYDDQKLYKQVPNSPPQALTSGEIRLADLCVTSKGIVAVAELHEDPTREPENFLALIDVNTGQIIRLAYGMNFYASPAISANERKIAWIAWQHPNMPWDDTTLWMADFTEEGLSNIVQIESDFPSQSFFQPQWDIHNQLWVGSDKSNWWNLYCVNEQKLEKKISLTGEIGQPMWVFGLSTWAFYDEGILFTHAVETGGRRLSYYHDGLIKTFDLPFTSYSHLRVSHDNIYCFAASPDHLNAFIQIDRNQKYSVIRKTSDFQIEPEDISRPIHFNFRSKGDRQSYAYFYAPKNRHAKEFIKGHPTLRPPLIVICHGGPTAQANQGLDLEIQYWTSRGFAILDVDYAGSTGYGRAYRQSLNGNWGLYDVEDCIAATEFVIREGWVDPQKIAMAGSSASGLTVLLALAQSDLFKAAVIKYGVTDLSALIKDTHKFEARYLDRLIGPYPQEKTKYEMRSPINQVDKIGCPILFFHGDEDKVVALSQTEEMIGKLRARGVMCECVVFEGEQHGFRQAKHRIKVLIGQQNFLLKCFG